MDVLIGAHDLARSIGRHLDSASSFRLLDVGCSNGVHDAFRSFGDRLTAWAFDIDGSECARLQAAETLPGVRYIAGEVALPEDHPFLVARSGRPRLPGNPWERLSVAATLRNRRGAGSAKSMLKPASLVAATDPIYLASFLATEGIHDLDFIKIDVDGEDFAILSDLAGKLMALETLAVGIEVNFFGTDDPTDHTLHNVDRLMRAQGYELFGLTVRHYSAAALPSRYRYWFPTETGFGRPLQGDPLYMRDLCAPAQRVMAGRLSPQKLAKAAAIFSLANLPDCAAEVLIEFRDHLSSFLDLDTALDLLTTIGRQEGMPIRYRDYITAFAADKACFYNWHSGPSPTQPTEAAVAPSEATTWTPVAAGGSPAEAQIGFLATETTRLRTELQALRNSRSWRLMGPYRRLGHMVRRLLPRANEP